MSKYMFNSSTSSAITGTRFNNASHIAEKTILSDFNLIASKQLITSVGIIAFTVNKQTREIKYLMIQRKHSVGFVDFVRGKYVLHNKMQILSLLSVMTESEHLRLVTEDFGSLWREMWGGHEDPMAREKLEHLRNGVMTNYNFYTLGDCIKEVASESLKWTHNDWGFPKGRKNFNETDLNCATREFTEETGIDQSFLSIITNIVPYEEIFTGSNFKSYKHKYFLAYVDERLEAEFSFQNTEVSKIAWKTFEDLNLCIRPYNLEKINLIKQVNKLLSKYNLYS